MTVTTKGDVDPLTAGFWGEEKASKQGLQQPLLQKLEEGKVSQNPNLVQHGGSSFLQSLLNTINFLTGIGILSTPYAVAQGGWLGLWLLLVFAAVCCYTGLLVRRCLDTNSSLESYADIGNAAFGKVGKWMVSIILYLELFLAAVEYLILEGDNLTKIFPIGSLHLGPITVTPRVLFVLIATLIMLPTVWVRDLSSLAYVSAGGSFACLAVVIAVAWVGAFNGVGFHHGRGPLLDLRGLPVAVGVYAFCYNGHAVLPNIYKSMKNRSQFNLVLVISFAVSTALYGSMAAIGYLMFGEDTESQVTLNLPEQYLASKIAVWITLMNPFAKYALVLWPITRALEEMIPYSPADKRHLLFGAGLKTLLVACTVTFALTVPVFGYLMAFTGSLLSVGNAIIIPCICFLKICGRHVKSWEFLLIQAILCVGFTAAILGTYWSILGIVDTL